MEFKPINKEDFELAMNIGWYSQISQYLEAREMFGFYPDLFVGCYSGPTLIGIAYGWPAYIHRWQKLVVDLAIISMKSEYRNQNLGSKLLKAWEDQVKKRGDWQIGLGAGPDSFYLKNGYTPVEYYLRVHKGYLRPDFREVADISSVRYAEDPFVVLYVETGGKFDKKRKDELQGLLGAESCGTIYRK